MFGQRAVGALFGGTGAFLNSLGIEIPAKLLALADEVIE
jgi:hypothetical protein